MSERNDMEFNVDYVYGGMIGDTLSARKHDHIWSDIIKKGVTTVIDVRRDSKSSDRLPCCCRRYGINYFHFPIEGTRNLANDVELFADFCSLIDNGYFYMECATGKYRVYIALCLYWVLYGADNHKKPPILNYFDEKKCEAQVLLSRSDVFHDFYRQLDMWNIVAPLPKKTFSQRFWLYNDIFQYNTFAICSEADIRDSSEAFQEWVVEAICLFHSSRNWAEDFYRKIRLFKNYISIYKQEIDKCLFELIDDWWWYADASEWDRDQASVLCYDEYACEYSDLYKDKPYYPKCVDKCFSSTHLMIECKKILIQYAKEGKYLDIIMWDEIILNALDLPASKLPKTLYYVPNINYNSCGFYIHLLETTRIPYATEWFRKRMHLIEVDAAQMKSDGIKLRRGMNSDWLIEPDVAVSKYFRDSKYKNLIEK